MTGTSKKIEGEIVDNFGYIRITKLETDIHYIVVTDDERFLGCFPLLQNARFFVASLLVLFEFERLSVGGWLRLWHNDEWQEAMLTDVKVCYSLRTKMPYIQVSVDHPLKVLNYTEALVQGNVELLEQQK